MAEDITEKKEDFELEHSVNHKNHKEHAEKYKDKANKKGKLGKLKWGRIILVLAVIVVIVIAVLMITKVIDVSNLFKKSEVESITINYVLSDLETGEPFAQNTQSILLSTDSSLSDTLGFKTNEIDKKIKELEVGEEIEFTLSAEDAYGVYDENKIFKINKTIPVESSTELERTMTVTLSQFVSAFGTAPIEGEVYGDTMIKYEAASVDSANVELKRTGTVGAKESYIEGFIDVKIEEIKEESIILRLVLVSEGKEMDSEIGQTKLKLTSDKNYIYYTLNPIIGDRFQYEERPEATVVEFDNKFITMDANHPQAGKEINVKVKVTERNKQIVSSGLIPGAPTLEVFVMSYCPFGTQMQKVLIPVHELLGNKANIVVRYVSYTMHGQKEQDENEIQICLREEQNDKFWPFLECFLETGENSEECRKKTGVNENKLQECLSSRVNMYYDIDKELNTKYGVKGSPSTFLDGSKVSSLERSPEAIKQAVCNVFKSKPKECNTQLSTEAASPGFGFGTGGSSSGTC